MTYKEFEKLADENMKKWPLRAMCSGKAIKLHDLYFLEEHHGEYWYGCISCKDLIKTDHELPIYTLLVKDQPKR